MTALVNLVPLRLAFVKSTLSRTALVKSAPAPKAVTLPDRSENQIRKQAVCNSLHHPTTTNMQRCFCTLLLQDVDTGCHVHRVLQIMAQVRTVICLHLLSLQHAKEFDCPNNHHANRDSNCQGCHTTIACYAATLLCTQSKTATTHTTEIGASGICLGHSGVVHGGVAKVCI